MESQTNAVPKIHPASREMLPEDPMDLHAFQVPGDPEFMLRLLVEEYARIGWDADAIMSLARNPNYQGFHGLLKLYGEQALREKVSATLARTGVLRVTAREKPPAPEVLVELNPQLLGERRADHGERL